MQNENDPICDYHFAPGHRAQYVYVDSDGTEQSIIINIIGHIFNDYEKVYIVSAHETLLEKAGLVCDKTLSQQYQSSLLENHKATYLDPDELVPAFRQFELVVDNTK